MYVEVVVDAYEVGRCILRDWHLEEDVGEVPIVEEAGRRQVEDGRFVPVVHRMSVVDDLGPEGGQTVDQAEDQVKKVGRMEIEDGGRSVPVEDLNVGGVVKVEVELQIQPDAYLLQRPRQEHRVEMAQPRLLEEDTNLLVQVDQVGPGWNKYVDECLSSRASTGLDPSRGRGRLELEVRDTPVKVIVGLYCADHEDLSVHWDSSRNR